MSAIRRCAWELKPVEVRIASKLLPKASVPESFRVRRVYLVGQNYNKHALEMGAARADPFFFAKPADTLIPEAKVMPYPPRTSDYHHEVELVIALGNPLNPFGEPEEYVNLTPDAAYKAVYGVGVGLDMTRRDLQAIAKKAGRPWDLSKGPDAGAPMSPITPLVEYAATRLKVSAEKATELIEKDPATVYKQIFEGSIELLKNGKKAQSGNLNLVLTLAYPMEAMMVELYVAYHKYTTQIALEQSALVALHERFSATAVPAAEKLLKEYHSEMNTFYRSSVIKVETTVFVGGTVGGKR